VKHQIKHERIHRELIALIPDLNNSNREYGNQVHASWLYNWQTIRIFFHAWLIY